MSNITKKPCGTIVEENLSVYGHYVAEDRALADLYDGLKPVQRRILWTVWDHLKLKPGSTSKRSARVTGDCTGTLHPHGTASVYSSLVNLTWHRYPLVVGEGNFGNMLSDMPPAAERYTGCSAAKMLPEMFKDQIVAPMESNYSGEFLEPSQLPTRLPLLLMNGSEGIAVGVASRIPPHNLKSLSKVLKQVLKKPDTKLKKLVSMLQGPDYSEGGKLLSGSAELLELYKTGNGSLTFRCNFKIDKVKRGYQMVVTSGCPQWNIPRFMKRCDALIAKGFLKWVSNESGAKVKVVCFARERDTLVKYVVPLLTKNVKYGWIALDKGKPIEFDLITYLNKWIAWRRVVVRQHLKYQDKELKDLLRKEEARLAAVKSPDAVVKAIRKPKPLQALMKALKLDKLQAKVVIKSSLRLLTRKGTSQQKSLVADLVKRRKAVKQKLKDIDLVVLDELNQLKVYYDVRRTEVKEARPKS